MEIYFQKFMQNEKKMHLAKIQASSFEIYELLWSTEKNQWKYIDK